MALALGAGAATSEAVAATLIAHYTFDETLANAAAVAGQPSLDLTLVGIAPEDAYVKDGARGGAIHLGGTHHLYTADAPALDIAGSITLAAWVRTESTSGGMIVGKHFGHENRSYDLRLFGASGDDLQVELIDTGDLASGDQEPNALNALGTDANDGEWHHVAATFEQSTGLVQLYVDGFVATSKEIGLNKTLLDSAVALTIGAFAGNSQGTIGAANTFFTGDLDDIRIYSGALTADEVAQLAGTVPEPTSSALVLGAIAVTAIARRRKR